MTLSVYILTYNRSEYLKQSIESVLAQTYRDFQLYILDNCSTDNTSEMISQIKDDRLHYIRHEQNIGAFQNGLYALKHCSTDYFVMFHDDDVMMPNLLEKEMMVVEEHPDAAIISGNAICFGPEIKEHIFLSEDQGITTFSDDGILKHYLATGETLVYPSIMYSKNFIRDHKIIYEEEAGPCMDVIFYSDIALAGGKVYRINTPLMHYRMHPGQDSNLNYFSMHIQLFTYLKQGKYGPLFEKLVEEREATNQRFARAILSYWLRDKIDREQAKAYFEEFRALLGAEKPAKCQILFKVCCKVSKPVKAIYRSYKK